MNISYIFLSVFLVNSVRSHADEGAVLDLDRRRLLEHQLLTLTTLSLWSYQLLILHQRLLLVIPSLLLVSNFYNRDLCLSLAALPVLRRSLISATAGLTHHRLSIPTDLF